MKECQSCSDLQGIVIWPQDLFRVSVGRSPHTVQFSLRVKKKSNVWRCFCLTLNRSLRPQSQKRNNSWCRWQEDNLWRIIPRRLVLLKISLQMPCNSYTTHCWLNVKTLNVLQAAPPHYHILAITMLWCTVKAYVCGLHLICSGFNQLFVLNY